MTAFLVFERQAVIKKEQEIRREKMHFLLKINEREVYTDGGGAYQKPQP